MTASNLVNASKYYKKGVIYMAQNSHGKAIKFEVVNTKFSWVVSMEDANFNFLNSEDRPEYDDQFFTGNWKKKNNFSFSSILSLNSLPDYFPIYF